MANAHGAAADPVGALKDRAEQDGFAVLQVAAPGGMERVWKSAWALEPWAPKDEPLGDSPQTHREI